MAEATFDRILAGLSAFSPTPTLFFGGLGEPLTHPHLVTWVAQAKLVGARVELITNGTLLNERVSRQLIETGLDLLWVSLDGATPESYADVRLGASLPKVMANLHCFNKLRPALPNPTPEIGIAFVAMQRNIADLPAMLQISKQVGASRLSVSNVLPYTPDMQSEILYSRVLNGASTYQPSKWMPHLNLPKMNPTNDFGQLLGQILDKGWNISLAGSNLEAKSNHCPFIEDGTLAIGWDGSISPCLPLLHDHTSFMDERQRASRRYIIGNVAEQTLADVWVLPEHIAFRQKVQVFDFAPCVSCGGCELAKTNEKDCLGNTFPTCGGCLWAQGVIQCP
jgi:MoaA/NifB/PqqE/SkfB family radical SAM enzyme